MKLITKFTVHNCFLIENKHKLKNFRKKTMKETNDYYPWVPFSVIVNGFNSTNYKFHSLRWQMLKSCR